MKEGTVKPPVRIMIARFPFGRSENPSITDWLVTTVGQMRTDERISEILNWSVDDTPITMGRNRCIRAAKDRKADFLLMIDSDMEIDAHLANVKSPLPSHPDAKPFWQTSFDFAWDMYQQDRPCVVAAPYCGPSPHQCVYVFKWHTDRSGTVHSPFSLEMYDREHADIMRGIQPAAALATGLILIDMNGIEKLDPPYFYYEWDDALEDAKASTEDVTFTRDLAMAGVEIFCNWDAWCGHWKRECVGRPVVIGTASVGAKFRRAVLYDANIKDPSDEFVMMPYVHSNGNGKPEATQPEEVPVHG